jgi:uncharacterized protein
VNVAPVTPGEIRAVADALIAAGDSPPRRARDPVNLPMIENWCEAIGAAIPAGAAAGTAPPAMIQVWTMLGLHGTRDGTDPTGQMVSALDRAGYASVVATNCDQVYYRYLRHGEQVAVRVKLTDLSGPKQTALGEGWFFTTRHTWSVGDEVVGTMDFRILKFRAAEGVAEARAEGARAAGAGESAEGARAAGAGESAEPPIRPVVSQDTAFFWDGVAAGELRIQRCAGCGTLRHPPGPMCPQCGAPQSGEPGPGYVVATGTGEVFSYVVHHHPQVPGRRAPFVVALVELTEGVRVLGELVGAPPDAVRIGMPVRIAFQRGLPVWRPADLPEFVVDVTPTFVIASALATRDFTPVHHDVGRAVAAGSKDIFVNILTTTGLVQRFVTDWAGPDAVVREISVRLGVPCYAGDTLTFTGAITERAGNDCRVAVTGRCSLGDHVTARVLVEVPA